MRDWRIDSGLLGVNGLLQNIAGQLYVRDRVFVARVIDRERIEESAAANCRDACGEIVAFVRALLVESFNGRVNGARVRRKLARSLGRIAATDRGCRREAWERADAETADPLDEGREFFSRLGQAGAGR